MRFAKGITLVVLLSMIAYALWNFVNPDEKALSDTSLFLREISEIGEDNGKGNIVGIQPYMVTSDYASLENFYDKIDLYFARAASEKLFRENTVVLLPKHIGTWLVALDEDPEVYEKEDWQSAVQAMASDHFFDAFTVNLVGTSASHKKEIEKLFRLKSPWMAEIYHYVFSSLAKKYNVSIIAGSILLAHPEVQEGELTVSSSGDFFNTTIVYDSSGKAHADVAKKPVRNIDLSYFEHGIERGKPFFEMENAPVYNLPIGRTCVLLPENLPSKTCEELVGKYRVDCVAIPSYKDNRLNGASEEQFLQEASKHSLRKTAFNVYLRGDLWNIKPDGCSTVVKNGKTTKAFEVEGSSIISLWL